MASAVEDTKIALFAHSLHTIRHSSWISWCVLRAIVRTLSTNIDKIQPGPCTKSLPRRSNFRRYPECMDIIVPATATSLICGGKSKSEQQKSYKKEKNFQACSDPF